MNVPSCGSVFFYSWRHHVILLTACIPQLYSVIFNAQTKTMVFVFIFIGLVLVILLISAFMPSRYQVEKSTVINKPVGQVMDRVGDLHHYATWNPWQQMDPSATKTITGAPKTSGHKYSWQGKKVGVGSLTIRGIDNRHIHFDLEFLKPWKSHAKDNWLFEDWGIAETKVTW